MSDTERGPRKRQMLSVEAQAELAERIKAERPGNRLGDQMHGPWCELIHEENRWWEAFFKAADCLGGGIENRRSDDRGGRVCAEFADEAIEQARKRGRL